MCVGLLPKIHFSKKMKKKQEEILDTKIREGVIEIYRNYGIDVSDMDDEDIKGVISHYKKNPDSLSNDIKSSKEKSYNILDNDII